MTWVVEVQHSSDKNLDGEWFELECCSTSEQADNLIRYFGTKSPVPKGFRPEDCVISGSYEGRPLRKREIIE